MKKSKLIRIIFEPDGMEVYVPAGTLLSKAASASGMSVETPCGGMGTCGKCRVVVSGVLGEPDAAERRLLRADELASGVRLACRTHVVGEMSVAIPDESRSVVQKILSRGVVRACELMPGVTKVHCSLPPPTLDDESAEFERLASHLAARDISLRPNLNVVRSMSPVMKSASYSVTATVHGEIASCFRSFSISSLNPMGLHLRAIYLSCISNVFGRI